MEQIVEYKNNPGNGYTNSLLCFMQLFIVSNGTDTRYFANNNNQHFKFNAKNAFTFCRHAEKTTRKLITYMNLPTTSLKNVHWDV